MIGSEEGGSVESGAEEGSTNEVSGLPPLSKQALVHPLDLPKARGAWLAGKWLGAIGSASVFFGIAAVLFAVSNNPVTPFIPSIVVFVAAWFARRWFDRDSWGYIPRPRQDRDRPTPGLDSAIIVLTGTIFLLGLAAVLSWIIAQDLGLDTVLVSAAIALCIALFAIGSDGIRLLRAVRAS